MGDGGHPLGPLRVGRLAAGVGDLDREHGHDRRQRVVGQRRARGRAGRAARSTSRSRQAGRANAVAIIVRHLRSAQPKRVEYRPRHRLRQAPERADGEGTIRYVSPAREATMTVPASDLIRPARTERDAGLLAVLGGAVGGLRSTYRDLRQGRRRECQLRLRDLDPHRGDPAGAGRACRRDRKWQPLGSVSRRSYVFLVLSGLATGGSWLCYFRALKLGDAAQVAPIDKLSVVLVAVFGVMFLGERLSGPTGGLVADRYRGGAGGVSGLTGVVVRSGCRQPYAPSRWRPRPAPRRPTAR